MASKTVLMPGGAFHFHARQLQQCRAISDIPLENIAFKTRKALAEQSPTNLFRKPASIISPAKARIDGAHEWHTSTYSYNKNTTKTLPVASQVTDKLLRDYMTMIRDIGTGNTGSSSTARNAVALRRRNELKMYLSETSIKDFGDRIVINAFAYDAANAAREQLGDAIGGRTKAPRKRPAARRGPSSNPATADGRARARGAVRTGRFMPNARSVLRTGPTMANRGGLARVGPARPFTPRTTPAGASPTLAAAAASPSTRTRTRPAPQPGSSGVVMRSLKLDRGSSDSKPSS